MATSPIWVSPDDELITAVAVTAANAADREVIDELLGNPVTDTTSAAPDSAATDADADADETIADHGEQVRTESEPNVFEVYGDSAYADGATLDEQTGRGHDMRAKVPPVRNANGYSKDRFGIDLAAGTVTCPAGHTVAISTGRRQQVARFGHCVGRVRCGRNAPRSAVDG